MRKIILSVAAMLMLCACGSDAKIDASTSEKDLFSSWALQGSQTNFALSLVGSGFGSQAYNIYLAGGGACACVMIIGGTQASGTITMASCIFDAQGTSGTDPGCSSINNAYTFTKTSDTLTLCKSASDCELYK